MRPSSFVRIVQGEDWGPYVVTDGKLITGQNPQAGLLLPPGASFCSEDVISDPDADHAQLRSTDAAQRFDISLCAHVGLVCASCPAVCSTDALQLSCRVGLHRV